MREGGSTTLDDLGEKRQGTEQRAGVGSKVSATLFLRVLPSSTAPHSLSFAFLESFVFALVVPARRDNGARRLRPSGSTLSETRRRLLTSGTLRRLSHSPGALTPRRTRESQVA